MFQVSHSFSLCWHNLQQALPGRSPGIFNLKRSASAALLSFISVHDCKSISNHASRAVILCAHTICSSPLALHTANPATVYIVEYTVLTLFATGRAFCHAGGCAGGIWQARFLALPHGPPRPRVSNWGGQQHLQQGLGRALCQAAWSV